MALNNINYIEVKNCIIDELHVRANVLDPDLTSERDVYQNDSYFLAKFLGNLEVGTIENGGQTIISFVLKRRKSGDINPIRISSFDYVSGQAINFIDYTQANDEYIYSIYPVGENGLEGVPIEGTIESNFVGWYVVDKNAQEVLAFDKFMGDSSPTVDTQLKQGRTIVETFSKYPQVYYDEREYNEFTLSTVIIPSEFEKSGINYNTILNKFISSHEPLIVKSGDGRIFVCDSHSPSLSSPMNTWKNHDYGVLTLSFTEVQDYDEYMQE
jgi:hypothetical protein